MDIDGFKTKITEFLNEGGCYRHDTVEEMAAAAHRLYETLMAVPGPIREAAVQIDLDEIVYELMGDRSTAEANQTDSEFEQEDAIVEGESQAADINNGGAAATQIAFIVANMGSQEAERRLEEVFNEHTPAVPKRVMEPPLAIALLREESLAPRLHDQHHTIIALDHDRLPSGTISPLAERAGQLVSPGGDAALRVQLRDRDPMLAMQHQDRIGGSSLGAGFRKK